jgi:polyketide synthase 12
VKAERRRPTAVIAVCRIRFHRAALRAQADKLHGHLGMNIEDRFVDVAFTRHTRSHFESAWYCWPETRLSSWMHWRRLRAWRNACRRPRASDEQSQDAVSRCFTGQEASCREWAGLSGCYPVFRQAWRRYGHFSALEKPLLDVMWAEAG